MRNPGLIVFYMIIVAGLAGGTYWYIHRPVTTAPTEAGTPVPYSELASGTNASVSERQNYLITTDEQLRDLWRLLGAKSNKPTIDFTKDAVIAIFAGNEPTAGYSIAVSAIADTSSERMVTVQIGVPGVTCLAAEVVMTPYQVLKIPKTDLPLTHKDVTTTTGCLQ